MIEFIIFLWSVNICNFNSLNVAVKSLNIFGPGLYTACISHVIPAGLHPKKILSGLNFGQNSIEKNNPENFNPKARSGREIYFKYCSTCHSGKLMTDQEAHNIGVPQLGPGKNDREDIDE